MVEIGLDFTTGLSSSVAWPWPIAVYLFLAGISGGAVAIAIALNLFRGTHADTPVMKAATVVGFVTIVLGMVCLVLDLTNPFMFWRILIYYNPSSVMSIGVMFLLFYIPLVFVLMLLVFRELPALGFIRGLLDAVNRVRPLIDWIVLILAVAICAYTGFLISALIRFPLINTAVLPALFVASGFSAGLASIRLIGAGCFGADREGADMHALHKAEWPIMAAEVLCLFMIFVSLISGNAAAKDAVAAFTCGIWAQVFWIGAVGVGFLIPFAANFTPRAVKESAGAFYFTALCGITGMMCLRLFILYAGQLNGL
jgi:protein NrfD